MCYLFVSNGFPPKGLSVICFVSTLLFMTQLVVWCGMVWCGVLVVLLVCLLKALVTPALLCCGLGKISKHLHRHYACMYVCMYVCTWL